ncbi:MAG: ABC transporter permease subunit [Clostridia bacterium]|nr:ABC transporter permease subunit [Clostridia bacterium]
MELILNGLTEAVRLIASGDAEIFGVTLLTLLVSGLATLLSLLIGVPLGVVLGLVRFRGRRLVVSLVNTGMGMPPVVVGLWVSIFLWRSGPFGALRLIYTPAAIVIAQTLIATPVITGFTIAAIQNLTPKLRLQILALGASRWQFLLTILKESRIALMAAVIAGFGSIVSEVGASMMVGGNIKGYTRVLTTATSMEVSKGNFPVAVALSIILVALAFGVTYLLTAFQQWERKDRNLKPFEDATFISSDKSGTGHLDGLTDGPSESNGSANGHKGAAK